MKLSTSATGPSLRVVLLVAAGIRAVILVTGILSFASVSHESPTQFRGSDPMMAWDALHYRDILLEGYPRQTSEGEVPARIAFFPGYPALAAPLMPALGPSVALLVLANLAAVAGLGLTFVWVRGLLGARAACATILLLSCYPPSMFLSSAYTEAPMLCAVAAGHLLAKHRRYWWAAAVGGIASALRPTGLLLSLLVFAWGARSLLAQNSRYKYLAVASMGALSVCGAVGYQVFLTAEYGRVDAYWAAQSTWNPKPSLGVNPTATGQSPRPPEPSHFGRVASAGAWNKLLMLGVLAVTGFGLLRPGRIPREAFLLPVGIFLLAYLPGWGSRVTSIARMETAAISSFALVGAFMSRFQRLLYLAAIVGLLGQCLLCYQFARGYWVG